MYVNAKRHLFDVSGMEERSVFSRSQILLNDIWAGVKTNNELKHQIYILISGVMGLVVDFLTVSLVASFFFSSAAFGSKSFPFVFLFVNKLI